MIAQAIHSASKRTKKKFVVQNLRGYTCNAAGGDTVRHGQRGLYRGGRPSRTFEIASGGTLFLDEINSMDMSMQAKLLRAIEDKKILRVGGLSSPITIDVKIISALNQDPIECQ